MIGTPYIVTAEDVAAISAGVVERGANGHVYFRSANRQAVWRVLECAGFTLHRGHPRHGTGWVRRDGMLSAVRYSAAGAWSAVIG